MENRGNLLWLAKKIPNSLVVSGILLKFAAV